MYAYRYSQWDGSQEVPPLNADDVLASLWEVNDRSTMQIMNDFYRGLRETNSAEALAQAQRAMLASHGRYSRPYYWAPFIVMTAKN